MLADPHHRDRTGEGQEVCLMDSGLTTVQIPARRAAKAAGSPTKQRTAMS
jgi:hypothetical protein